MLLHAPFCDDQETLLEAGILLHAPFCDAIRHQIGLIKGTLFLSWVTPPPKRKEEERLVYCHCGKTKRLLAMQLYQSSF